jgi:hypothetical protein
LLSQMLSHQHTLHSVLPVRFHYRKQTKDAMNVAVKFILAKDRTSDSSGRS